MDDFANFRTLTIIFASLMLFKYFFYLMVAPFYKIKELLRYKKTLKNYYKGEYNPLVSIIVPAWNEEVGILKTVQSVVENSYKRIQLIVIDDGSTDNTRKIFKDYLKKHNRNISEDKIKIIYIYKDNSGKGESMNKGISRSTGDIIVTLDADSFLAKNAILNLVEYFKDPEIAAVVGNVKIAGNNSFIGLIQRLEYTFGFYFKRVHAVFDSEYIFGGACSAYRRSVIDKIGQFDVSNKTEDIELSLRLKYYGYKSTYAEDVVCYTEGAGNLTGLINQRLRWKKGRLDTFFKYRSMFFSFNKKHNKFLSWYVLPIAVLQELQLFIEPISIALLVSYSFISGDYVSLTFGFLFILIIYIVTTLDTREGIKLDILLVFPATWIFFYLLVWVEFLALIKGVFMILRNETVTWQKWQRQGI